MNGSCHYGTYQGGGGPCKAAYEIIRNCGYPSQAEAIHLIHDGNFTHMPMLTAEDIKRAYELYGEPVGCRKCTG
jgi:hypothetical protein